MSQRLAVDVDDLRSVIRRKANKPWSGSAMEAETRHVRALHGGDRRRKRAKQLGAKRPQAYRQPATFDTDQSVV